MDFLITEISAEHIEQTVEIHIQAFPGFFLMFLGPRFLKAFYGSFTEDRAGIGFVAKDCKTKEVIGVVVGRLVPDKGIHILVESFVRLYESSPNIRLLIIGDFEPHRGRLPDKTTQALNNHPRIVHVGFTHQIEPYYAAMDMLVLPTRREGFPYTILEAAAMGLPVAATEVTGCVDAVLEGRTGFLVPPEDVTALTAAIQKLLASPRLRQQMGCEGTKRVEEEFTSQRLLDAHVQLYRGMLGL